MGIVFRIAVCFSLVLPLTAQDAAEDGRDLGVVDFGLSNHISADSIYGSPRMQELVEKQADDIVAASQRLMTRQEKRVEETSVLSPHLTAEQRQQLLALGDDLEQLWDHSHAPAMLKKRILRTVLQEVIADTTDDPPSVHLKLHWAGGSHTELTVRKNQIGYHNHINSEEVTGLIRELALVCADSSIVSILNRLGYRTGNGNTWTEKRVQHVRHTNGFPACPPSDQRLWITMQQAAAKLGVSEMVVRRLIAQKSLPAKQIVKFAPWMIERSHLDLPSVRKEIRRVHEGRRTGWAVSEKQTGLFADSHEA